MRLRTTPRSAVLVGLVLLATAACSGGGGKTDGPTASASSKSLKEKTPQQLVDTVQATFRTVESLRLEGSLYENGTEIGVDLTVGGEGRCTGEISVGGAGSVELIGSGETLWFKPDLQYAAALVANLPTAEAARFTSRLGGTRYLELPKTHPLVKELSAYCDRAGVKNLLEEGFLPGEELTAGPAGTVNGQETVSYRYTSTDDSGTTVTTTVHVSVKGLLPVQVEDRSRGTSSRLTFTGYDEPVRVTRPDTDRIVPVAEVQKTLDLATPGA
ncbi:hypothetical protein ACIA8O_15525 [Kitasatospora sp. NPDC051853]|uniref:hypothetical protein n=1 Tax=Kitasatospora sp. NPDC051853 TaxID=3364058 RepID=UPI003793F146